MNVISHAMLSLIVCIKTSQNTFNMATVNNISLDLALNELKSLVEIFSDAVQNSEKCIQLESGMLSLPKMINTNKIISFITKNSTSKSHSTKKLYGDDLHKYLLSLVIRYEPSNNLFPKNSENNFNTLIEFLQNDGTKILKYSKKRLFSDYCRYGYVLHKVFNLYREKMMKKEVNKPFSDFVEDNFSISSRQALKLRHIGELWYSYKRLENLGITLEEFYQRINEIKTFLNTHSNLAAYWRSDADSNLTSEISEVIKIE